MYLHTVLKQRMVKVCSPLKIGNSVLAILRFVRNFSRIAFECGFTTKIPPSHKLQFWRSSRSKLWFAGMSKMLRKQYIFVKERTLFSFIYLFSQFPGIFGSQQLHYQEVIHQMLGQCMQVQEASQVSWTEGVAFQRRPQVVQCSTVNRFRSAHYQSCGTAKSELTNLCF